MEMTLYMMYLFNINIHFFLVSLFQIHKVDAVVSYRVDEDDD